MRKSALVSAAVGLAVAAAIGACEPGAVPAGGGQPTPAHSWAWRSESTCPDDFLEGAVFVRGTLQRESPKARSGDLVPAGALAGKLCRYYPAFLKDLPDYRLLSAHPLVATPAELVSYLNALPDQEPHPSATGPDSGCPLLPSAPYKILLTYEQGTLVVDLDTNYSCAAHDGAVRNIESPSALLAMFEAGDVRGW